MKVLLSRPGIFLGLLMVILAIRWIGAAWLPIMDSQESRYAEIARKMLELDQFLVPMSTYELPFWGKPPLTFWLSALSMDVMGITELSARIPSLIFGMLVCWLIYLTAQPQRETGLLAALIFASAHLGHTATGDVTTDPALTFAITLAMFGFWQGFIGDAKSLYWVGVLGLAASLLIKGPVALVLVLISLALWFTFSASWIRSLAQPRLWCGLFVAIALVAPWYLMAESASPGFLDYFLVGEHYQRFIEPDWAGDLYGSGHASTRGAVWVYALDGMLPWSLLLLALIPMAWHQRVSLKAALGKPDIQFLLAWMLAPLILFSLGTNVRGTYVMPAMPAMSLLTAKVLQHGLHQMDGLKQRILLTLILIGALLVPGIKLTGALQADSVYLGTRHQRPMVNLYQQLAQRQPGDLYYFGRRRRAAEFYSAGAVMYLPDAPAFNLRLKQTDPFYLAIHDNAELALPQTCESRGARSGYRLMYCR